MNDLLHLARLALAFGCVDRVTRHPDGVTPESDTDHTVMLALVAPAMAARLRPDLRPDLVCAFAVVHDLVEVKTGDTNTIGITAEGRAAKAAREAAALAELREELVAFPWIVDTLDRYEAQEEPEARWTRYIDKVLPKLTHALNHGATLRAMGTSIGVIRTDGERQRELLRTEYPEFPEADALLWQAVAEAEAMKPGRRSGKAIRRLIMARERAELQAARCDDWGAAAGVSRCAMDAENMPRTSADADLSSRR